MKLLVANPTLLLLTSHVQLLEIPWTAARQASLSFTISQSLLKLTSIESVMPFNHLILCSPLPLLPSIFPSIRVISNESTLKKAQFLKNIKRRIEFCDVRITVILNVSNHNKVLLEHTYTFKETKVPPLQELKVSSYQSPWLVGTKNFQ